jgi:hypothetical protein
LESLLGTSLQVYVGLTVIFMGVVAYLTGQAIANTWRPLWQVFPSCFLLGLTARFLIYALFQGSLLSPGIVVDVTVLTISGLIAYRFTQVTKMVSQYPWLYERCGWWRYAEKPSST